MPAMISEAIDNQITNQSHQPAPALAGHFEIGDWLVMPELNRLQHRCLSLHRQLEPRLIHLLCYLAANTNQVLSRQALIQELWPTVVVNENSLTRAVSELRKQLISPQPIEPDTSNYIETIPKKGYRLLPAIIAVPIANAETDDLYTSGLSSHQAMQSPRAKNALWLKSMMPAAILNRQWKYRTAIPALCLSFLIGSWIFLDFADRLNSDSSIIQLADELIENTPEFFGGELTLSTMDGPQPVVESIAKPIISTDEKQYAFIQYDNAGSTIFLGGLGTAIEPVPVFNSSQHISNLTWAPVGNGLLFAMKPVMTTAALYSSLRDGAELVLLDLETFETSRLIQEQIPSEESSSTESNLT